MYTCSLLYNPVTSECTKHRSKFGHNCLKSSLSMAEKDAFSPELILAVCYNNTVTINVYRSSYKRIFNNKTVMLCVTSCHRHFPSEKEKSGTYQSIKSTSIPYLKYILILLLIKLNKERLYTQNSIKANNENAYR